MEWSRFSAGAPRAQLATSSLSARWAPGKDRDRNQGFLDKKAEQEEQQGKEDLLAGSPEHSVGRSTCSVKKARMRNSFYP